MDTSKLRERARKLVAAAKHDKAAEAFAELAAAERDNARWPQKLGESYQRLGRPKAAVEAFSTAAGLYARQGFLLKAVAICRVILSIDPAHVATQEMLSELYGSHAMLAGGGGLGGQVPAAALPQVPTKGGEDIPIAVEASVEAEERAVARELGHEEPRRPSAARPSAARLAAARLARPPRPQAVDRAAPTAPEQPVVVAVDRSAPTGSSEGGSTMEVAAAEIIEVDEIADDAEDLLPEIEAIELAPLKVPAPSARSTSTGPLVASSTMELDGDALIELGESLDCIELSAVLEALPPDVRAEIEGKSPPEQTREGVFELNLDEEDLEVAFEAIEAPSPVERILDVMPATPLFSSLDRPALRLLIERVEVRMYGPREQIIRQGESGTSLFVLVEGTVRVWREGKGPRGGARRVEIGRLEEGAFFGEIALLTKRERSATVESVGECTVLEISREVIGELVLRHPAVLRVLLRFFRERLIDSLVDTHELFAPFAGPDRDSLAQRFTFIEAAPRTVLARQGEPADGLYIVLAGQAKAERAGGGSSLLSSGDVFGETSLLTGEDSVATVTTAGKCWLLLMEQRIFRETIMTHPHVLAVLSDISAQRREARSAALCGGQLDETQIPLL